MKNMSNIFYLCFYMILFTILSTNCSVFDNSQNSLFNLRKFGNKDDVLTYRKLVAQQNMKIIFQVNSNPNLGYKFEPNQFLEFTENQCRKIFLTLIPSQTVTIEFARAITQRKPQQTQYIYSQNSIGNSKIRTLQESHDHQNAQSLQKSVIAIVKQNFHKKKQIPLQKIQDQIIPQYQYQGDLNHIKIISQDLQHKRLLQQNKNISSPKNVDWSCVSGRVKQQGSCGASHIFPVLDSVASNMVIYHFPYFVELSAQQIIDCSQNSLTFGCFGGFFEGTFSYLQNYGVSIDQKYPYTSGKLKQIDQNNSSVICKRPKKQLHYWQIDNFMTIPEGDCEGIKTQLQKQPIVVGITGVQILFYRSGIFSGCSKNQNDHGVLLVGYQDGVGWRIKNSWGTKWGQNGYGWISEKNDCGICKLAFYSVPQSKFGKSAYQNNQKLITCQAP